jgi:hypothetical protein
MKSILAHLGIALSVATSAVAWAGTTADELPRWEILEPGLALGTFALGGAEPVPGPAVHVLRIDLELFELTLFNASANNNLLLTPRQWASSRGLVSVINASMFQEDMLTSVSLMRTQDHTNNRRQSKDKSILAFDPSIEGVPRVKILDRQCDDFDEWKGKYGTLIQSIRMISCDGRNVWRARGRKSSVSAVGMDRNGHFLFIHTGALIGTHDLIETLLQLPIGISRAMYVEGGPQAQLYVDSGGRTLELSGSLNPLLGGSGALAWPLPNVLGIRRRR